MAEQSMIVDRRCWRCQDGGRTDMYRMIGGCRNCGSEPLLGLFSVTHEATGGDCPVCKCSRLHWDRVATADEIPRAFEAALGTEPGADQESTEGTRP